MYNEKLKHSFLNDMVKPNSSTEKMYLSVFRTIAPYESAWNTDICTRSGEELRPIIDELTHARARNRWQRVNALSQYCQWCVTHGIPGAVNGLHGVDLGLGLDKIRSTSVANPTQLQRYLNELYRDESDDTVDNIYRCYCWMAYFGIAEKELVEIKCDQVDLNEMVIHYHGTDVQIDQKARAAFKSAKTRSDFKYDHPIYGEVSRPRATGDTLVRGFRPTNYMSVRSKLSKDVRDACKSGKTQIQMSYKRLRRSGLFHAIREYEEESGRSYDFLKAAEEYMAGTEYNLSRTRVTIEMVRNQIANELKQDYERWRLAHNI